MLVTVAFQRCHSEMTCHEELFDKELSTFCIDILVTKNNWFTEINVTLTCKILEEVRMDLFCKMKLNLVLEKCFLTMNNNNNIISNKINTF
jgi:hypothetical protein